MMRHTCKHHRSSHLHTTCAAGVCYRDVTPEPDRQHAVILRMPCHAPGWMDSYRKDSKAHEEFAKRGTCDKFELPTDAELKADEEEFRKLAAAGAKVGTVIDAHRRKAKATGFCGQRQVKCPACGESAMLSFAPCNFHARYRCACMSMIE